jgi:arylformamidase
MSRLIDLSHTIEHGMITYKGLPAPLICDYLSREASRQFYAPGTEFQIGKIEMVANTGTYIDSPFHRYADGHDLSELMLDQLAQLDGVVVHKPFEGDGDGDGDGDGGGGDGLAVDVDRFTGLDLAGKAVLIHTGWDRHWRTDQYFENHPFLTEAAARHLVAAGATLVGIDSHNIDDTRGRTRPVHTILLRAGIPICEHLCHLDALPDRGFSFSAVPPKVKAFGTFPVRAYACIRSSRG